MAKQKLSKFYEVIPYVIWIVLLAFIAFLVQGDLVITVMSSFVIMIISLLVVPHYASGAAKMGIFGSPCKWGFHQIDNNGYNLECKRCMKKIS